MKVIGYDERGCPLWKSDDWKEEIKKEPKVEKIEDKPKVEVKPKSKPKYKSK